VQQYVSVVQDSRQLLQWPPSELVFLGVHVASFIVRQVFVWDWLVCGVDPSAAVH
jgi:hypothetical protein